MSARAIAAAVVALLIGSLLVWALLERSGRLGCEVKAAALTAAYNVLADSAKRQSQAVADLEAKAVAARAQGRHEAIAAAAEAKLAQPKIDALSASLAVPTPAAQGCHEALERIRSVL